MHTDKRILIIQPDKSMGEKIGYSDSENPSNGLARRRKLPV
jgi:hypothetical protein